MRYDCQHTEEIPGFRRNDKTYPMGELCLSDKSFFIKAAARKKKPIYFGKGSDIVKEYLSESSEVLRSVQSSKEGLTDAQAQARLEKNGPNRLKEGKKESLLMRFLKQFCEPMIIVLLAAAAVSLFMSILEGEFPSDVIIIVAVVLINAILGVLQESKAEKAIAALQEIAAATSKVIRNGHQITVKSEELVVGDIIVLEAGDAVPADARIIECASLKIEEAALTGESVPVTKQDGVITAGENGTVPLGDRKNMVYMGSTVVYGRALAVVCATGMDTEMGKIADALSQAQDGKTPLQQKLAQLSKLLTYLVLGICVIIFGINMIRSLFTPEGMGIHVALDSFMVAVSLAVAAIPEGLATVVTIVLSIGVTNMSRRNAIIRKLTAVETLGCTQIICSDKTGTLTQNKMTVVDYYGNDQTKIATAMSLCSDAQLDSDSKDAVGEPTECALVNYAFSLGLDKNVQKEEYPRIGEVPFDSGRKMMSTVHQTKDGNILQFTKGAPDEILKRCVGYYKDGEVLPMTEALRDEILCANKNMADKALRVLAVAQKELTEAPASYEAESVEKDLVFLGLTGMIDPVRPEVKPAIDQCRMAGIRPIMITCDHKDTAVAIAMQLGIISDPSEAITGAELDAISDEDFQEVVTRYSVYARVQPEHKTRIVNAWRAKGKVTAMTGDGVNDAPSIKNADIGVGMGITGTDVTKNVADMILADDNFATIVAAAGEGRRIYDNIRKAIQFLLASNLSEVLSIFFATLFGFTILKPTHLLWINLITDTFPALALGMEKPEADVMTRKPRSTKEGIFAGGVGFAVAYQGVLVTLLTMISFFIGHYLEFGTFGFADSEHGVTMAFLTLSMCEIFHAFNMRSLHGSIFKIKRQNLWLWGAGAASLLMTTLVIEVSFLADAFEFVPIGIVEYLIAMGLAITVIPIVELTKFFVRLRDKKKASNE